jgi:hypothetical protein
MSRALLLELEREVLRAGNGESRSHCIPGQFGDVHVVEIEQEALGIDTSDEEQFLNHVLEPRSTSLHDFQETGIFLTQRLVPGPIRSR